MAEEPFSSFAKTLVTLQKLTKIESGVSQIISSSRVPHAETRKFLRCERLEQGINTPLFQFIRKMVKDVGLGDMEMVEIGQFKHVYSIRSNPVASLYPEVQNKKTCYVTSDAFSQFYSKDMGLVNTGEEVECINAGDQACVFEINLQPLGVYQIVLDRTDRRLVEVLGKNAKLDIGSLADELLLEPGEVEYRLEILRRYHLTDDDFSLTKIGTTYSRYGTGPLAEKE
ncbi:MAG: hypothetical protein KAT70_06890, partial [Thermoplasmata archaeon]|nr:hypothetical protein [Thermoplasmata archaeon]